MAAKVRQLRHLLARTRDEPRAELIAGTPEWENAIAAVTTIDVDEFKRAHDDPEWVRFCEEADEYVASFERELQPH